MSDATAETTEDQSKPPAAAEIDPQDPKSAAYRPVTYEDVVRTIQTLKQEGVKDPSRRDVRAALGRGSMTTIHRLMDEYQASLTPPVPAFDISEADQAVVVEIGSNLVNILKGRLQNIMEEREGALRQAVATAEAKAADAMTSADQEIFAAQKRLKGAESAMELMTQELRIARLYEGEAKEKVVKIQGQMETLAADRDLALSRVASLEEGLARAEGRIDADTKTISEIRKALEDGEKRYEALISSSAAAAKEQAETITQLSMTVASRSALLDEATKERDALAKQIREQQETISNLRVSLQASEAKTVAFEQAGQQARQELERARQELEREQTRNQDLQTMLKSLMNSSQATADALAEIKIAIDQQAEDKLPSQTATQTERT